MIIIVVLVVVLVAAIAAVLYVMLSGLACGPSVPRAMGVDIWVTGDLANWTVAIRSAPSGLMPATTFLLIRNNQGAISLHMTSFSSLTWATDHATYQDAAPAVPEVRAGDALLISRWWYEAGSTMQIIEDAGVLASRFLQ